MTRNDNRVRIAKSLWWLWSFIPLLNGVSWIHLCMVGNNPKYLWKAAVYIAPVYTVFNALSFELLFKIAGISTPGNQDDFFAMLAAIAVLLWMFSWIPNIIQVFIERKKLRAFLIEKLPIENTGLTSSDISLLEVVTQVEKTATKQVDVEHEGKISSIQSASPKPVHSILVTEGKTHNEVLNDLAEELDTQKQEIGLSKSEVAFLQSQQKQLKDMVNAQLVENLSNGSISNFYYKFSEDMEGWRKSNVSFWADIIVSDIIQQVEALQSGKPSEVICFANHILAEIVIHSP